VCAKSDCNASQRLSPDFATQIHLNAAFVVREIIFPKQTPSWRRQVNLRQPFGIQIDMLYISRLTSLGLKQTIALAQVLNTSTYCNVIEHRSQICTPTNNDVSWHLQVLPARRPAESAHICLSFHQVL